MSGAKLSAMDQALVDAEAGTLRSDGKTYRQIAESMNCSIGAAHDRVGRCYAAIRAESITVAKDLDLERLDEMLRVALNQMRADHVKIDHGHVVTMPDGTPVIDHGAKLAALDRLLKIRDSRARLLGLDAPTKSRHEVITRDAFMEAMSDLEAEVASLEAEAASGGVA